MTIVHPSVAARRNIIKFGDSINLPSGPDPNTTSLAENVNLKLTHGLSQSSNNQPEQEEEQTKKTISVGILCRICKGSHFSSKCPYKDTHQPLDVIQSTIEQAKESVSSDAPAKYIPPSLRNRAPGATGPSSLESRRDEFPTIRITNLSEDATENDVRALVGKFGTTYRVFVARDKDTNMCKGFAFVSYHTRESCQKAIDSLNGFGYDSLILRVEWSNKD